MAGDKHPRYLSAQVRYITPAVRGWFLQPGLAHFLTHFLKIENRYDEARSERVRIQSIDVGDDNGDLTVVSIMMEVDGSVVECFVKELS